MPPLNPKDLAGVIDHTLLRPDAREKELEDHCRQAVRWNFFAVCIPPFFVHEAWEIVRGSSVRVCTVVGFPLGIAATPVKINEAVLAVEAGAREIDMVINRSWMKSEKYREVENEIRGVTQALPPDCPVKAILETAELNAGEIRRGCRIAESAGARFVKTSTGFASGGATVEAVRIMAETVGARLGIKASGGIRDFKTACSMLEAGATRLGTSASLKIIQAE